MLNLKNIATNERTITISTEAGSFSVTYRPSVMTGEWLEKQPDLDAMTAAEQQAYLETSTVELVKAWEIAVGEQPLPVTKEAIHANLPLWVLMAIRTAINSDLGKLGRGTAST